MPHTDTTAVQSSAPDQRGGPAPLAGVPAQCQAALHAVACTVNTLTNDAQLTLSLADYVEAMPREHRPDDGEDYADALRSCADLALKLSTFLNLFVVGRLSGSRNPADIWDRGSMPGSVLDPSLNAHLDTLERFADAISQTPAHAEAAQ